MCVQSMCAACIPERLHLSLLSSCIDATRCQVQCYVAWLFCCLYGSVTSRAMASTSQTQCSRDNFLMFTKSKMNQKLEIIIDNNSLFQSHKYSESCAYPNSLNVLTYMTNRGHINKYMINIYLCKQIFFLYNK